jgi:hypothetical protein
MVSVAGCSIRVGARKMPPITLAGFAVSSAFSEFLGDNEWFERALAGASLRSVKASYCGHWILVDFLIWPLRVGTPALVIARTKTRNRGP